MAKKKEHPYGFKFFDTTAVYRCPMIRKSSIYPNEIEDVIDVKLVMDKYGYTLTPLVEGYHHKYFYDTLLDWLFYTGYVVKK